MMSGGARGVRQPADFYPTPPEATEALLRWLNAEGLIDALTLIWDPACGDGALIDIFDRAGYDCLSSDLNDHGYGRTGLDFLETTRSTLAGYGDYAIITNPPFMAHLPDRFIRHSREVLRTGLLCLLLKSTFWNGGAGRKGQPSRNALWRDHRPHYRLTLTWRLDFLGLGNPTMDCEWNVWLFGNADRTVCERLSKPVAGRELL